MSINSFADADLRVLPSDVLAARLTAVQTAINARLAGTSPEVAQRYAINGRQVDRTPLEFLMLYEAALYRARAMQAAEPSGLGLLDVRFPGSGG